MKRDDFYEKLHKKHEGTFKALCAKIKRGVFSFVDVRVDSAGRNMTRVTIYLREKEKENE